jgi:hypothetical protein
LADPLIASDAISTVTTLMRGGIMRKIRCAKNLIFLSPLRLIWAVQTSAQKYFVLLEAQISSSSHASRLTRGAYRDRHGRWVRDAMSAAMSRDE